MVQAFGSAYVKTARAKGVRDRSIIFVHTLRNAMLPVITVVGDQAAALLNGAVVVETIFGFPGVGKLMINSILSRDFNVILAAIMVTALRDLRDEPADRHRLRGARSAHPDLSRCTASTDLQLAERRRPASRLGSVLGMLWRDKFADRRGDLPGDRDPLRDLRPGAARRGRDPAEPARPQRTRRSASSTAG